jgi:hypothetical protein
MKLTMTARTVFARPITKIVDSNPNRGTDVCAFILFLLPCVWVEALRKADPPVQGILPTVYRISKLKKKNDQGPTMRCRAIGDDDDKLKNSVAWVREETRPTERQSLVGEDSANLCG